MPCRHLTTSLQAIVGGASKKLGVTGLPQSLDRCKDGMAYSFLIHLVVGPHEFEGRQSALEELAARLTRSASVEQMPWRTQILGRQDQERTKAPRPNISSNISGVVLSSDVTFVRTSASVARARSIAGRAPMVATQSMSLR